MKLTCLTKGEGFLAYPDGVVTVGKVYDAYTDFELPNMLLFKGDNGAVYKVINTYFTPAEPLEDCFFDQIDFELLRRQKIALLEAMRITGDQTLEGLLTFVDNVQDYAVDSLYYAEEQVFGKMTEE
jgi:hypothetical protein